MNDFQNEWAIVHKDIENYERSSLHIKLGAVFVSVLSVAYAVNVWLGVLFVMVLWLQDGIWKTFQKRLERRILFIEQQIKSEDIEGAFQLYSQWQGQRQGVVGLVKEYLLNSLKPTVAFPYVVLTGLLVIALAGFRSLG